MEALLTKQLKLAGNIANFYTNSTDKVGAENQTESHFVARLELLESYWEKFTNNHDQLVCNEKELAAQQYFAEDGYSFVELEYIRAKSRIRDLLALRRPPPPAPTSQVTEAAPTNRSELRIEQFSALPSLALPKFSGKQEEWESFKQRFSSLVRDKESIPKVAKLQHLLNAVQGPAALRLRGMEITEANFDVAWDKLMRRYDNKRIRLTNTLEHLIQLPMVKARNAQELSDLIDHSEEAVRSLKELQCPVEHYDAWIVHCVVRKLDANSRESWEISREDAADLPTYSDLVNFLERRIHSLEQARPSNETRDAHTTRSRNGGQQRAFANNTQVQEDSNEARNAPLCDLCQSAHWLHKCFKFLAMAQPQRLEFCRKKKLCLNCLHRSHFVDRCPSNSRCWTCRRKHHTKLHADDADRRTTRRREASGGGEDQVDRVEDPEADSMMEPTVNAHTTIASADILLATARVKIMAADGTSLTVRALIDPAAQRSFISERLAAQLQLSRRKTAWAIIGLGAGVTARARSEMCCTIKSLKLADFAMDISALILPEITRYLPQQKIPFDSWPHLKDLELADPQFHVPAKVDCVLAADVYPLLILEGLVKGRIGSPVAQNTVFGWIITGPMLPDRKFLDVATVRAFHTIVEPSVSSMVSKLWELEEVQEKQHLTEDEKRCEDSFTRTHYRDENGRFVVRLPFAKQLALGDSRGAAQACLLRTEKRFSLNASLCEAYSTFMKEYAELGHMELVLPGQRSRPSFYMPHHAVFRDDKPGKIRVVFNASRKTTNGLSLNDVLLPGPKLQADITVVLTNWRFFKCAGTTDVEKMFRQIRVHDDDVDFQRVLWRLEPSLPIQDFRCTTVTYGTAAAPFLALRVMQQLAEDGQRAYPEAAEALRHQLYVDDVFFGADSLEEALSRRDQIVKLLASAGMRLGKWAASDPRLVDGLVSESRDAVPLRVDEMVSTLGLKWLPSQDSFTFQFAARPEPVEVTKRSILAAIARTFDPLGWLSPALVPAKILLQDLCLDGVDWDAPIPAALEQRWKDFTCALPDVSRVRVKRWLDICEGEEWHLHGFADASKRAYAAAIYAVIPGRSSHLIVAKTKLAPTKVQTVPRLELCAAVLLVRLARHLIDDLRFAPAKVYCWSDSKVVLDWIACHPSRWPTFVANRVSEVQSKLPDAHWNHVRTMDNSADCATRGLTPLELSEFSLWWSGPGWLIEEESSWPRLTTANEIAASVSAAEIDVRMATDAVTECLPDFSKFSSFNKIIRIISLCRRWRTRSVQPREDSSSEWMKARLLCFKLIQAHHFADEIRALKAGKALHKRSLLVRLTPFIDSNDILRVGGRLHNAQLPFDERHPIILPGSCPLVRRMIEATHEDLLHGGPQLMRSHLSRTVWITRGVRVIRGVCQRCVRCTRYKAAAISQQMAPLPADRVKPGRPFSITGVDYAGPLPVLFSKGKGARATKGYIAIFVCMVVRAVHVEIVSDLTTSAFLAAYDRFVSRRGPPSVMYSDNATTFKSASKELASLFRQSSAFRVRIEKTLARRGVRWTFIPPRAPHFGGLWEAAVRSFKHHLRRVIGSSRLTFEELSTLAARIEACLNSRPLCPMSSDPDELAALTPAHFLTGTSLLGYPEPYDPEEKRRHLTSRWRLLRSMRDMFWTRWRREVLNQFQQRYKWLDPRPNLQEGDMVLIRDDLSPPSEWPLGRVVKTHPGADGLVRVATIRTAQSTFTRPVVKLTRLPTDSDAEEYYVEQKRRRN